MARPASSVWDNLKVPCKWLVDLGTQLHDAICPSVADLMQHALPNIADGGSTAVSLKTSAAVVSDKKRDRDSDVTSTNPSASKIAKSSSGLSDQVLFDKSSSGLSDQELSGSPWVQDLMVFMWSKSENKTVLGTAVYRQGRRYTDLPKAIEFQLIFARFSEPDQPEVAPEQLAHWFTPADMTYIQKEPVDANSPMQEFAHCD